MYYYQHHIGDFIKDTSRLKDSQCMAYLRMIWMYYDNELPFENNPERIAFNIGADSSDVSLILESFFYLKDDLWHHKRCDSELESYKLKKEKASESANARWRNKDKNMRTHENNMRTHSERNANEPFFDANQEPITNINTNTKESKKESPFLLPDWINSEDWDLWMKSRKKKMIPAQMQKQVDKLRKWKDTGQDYAGALENAAANGYTGLFLPDNKASPQQQKPKKFNASEYLQGYGDGYGNPLPRKENEIIDIN